MLLLVHGLGARYKRGGAAKGVVAEQWSLRVDNEPERPEPNPYGRNKKRRGPLHQLKRLLLRKALGRPLKLTEDHVHSILLVRRAAIESAGPNLFSDPAWYMWLELYAAHLGGRTMSLSELARATDTSESVAKRWLAELARRELITIADGTTDPAHLRVKLSSECVSKTEHLVAHWASAFVSI